MSSPQSPRFEILEPRLLLSAGTPSSMLDLNGDGQVDAADMVLAQASPGPVSTPEPGDSLMLNETEPVTFTKVVTGLPTGNWTTGEWGDHHGDGLPDLVVFGGSGARL